MSWEMAQERVKGIRKPLSRMCEVGHVSRAGSPMRSAAVVVE